jgi:ribonuclease G
MSKELVISSNRHETRVALFEDDQVVEVFHQREHEYSLAGSIHKGRVTRVLPGMQSAFVDIGLERDAFLYVSDFFEDNEEYDKIVTSVEETVLKLERSPAAASAEAPPQEAPVVETVGPVEQAAAPVSGGAPAPAADSRRDDRDRRGRRSRRRRGGKGGRGLPESKYYSARNDAEAPAAPVEEQESIPAAAEPTVAGDDFFVLPGESLAKHAKPGEGGDEAEGVGFVPAAEERWEAQRAGEPEIPAAESEAAAEPDEPEALPPAEPEAQEAFAVETQAEIAEEPASEPQSELLAAVAVAAEEFEETEEPEAVAPGEAEEALAEETAEEAETAEDVDVAAADAAEPTEQAEADEAGADPEDGDAALAEALTERLEAGVSEDEPAAAEGEPLAANVREQSGRYPHRVSRRMRRRRGDRPANEAPRPLGPRAPEARVPEPAAAPPEQRTAPRGADARAERGPGPSISELLKAGQEIIVQVAKEPLGQKGARITSHIALPGRFLVYMPTVDHIGVSRKIPSDDERMRLKRVLQAHRTGIPGGYIVRTAGEGRTEEELRADMMFLYNLWLDMRQKAERRPAPLLIHHDLNVVERVLRDQLTSAFKSIWVDNEEAYESVLRFVQRFQPSLVTRVKMYTRSTPIFDEFSVTSELEKALRPKVWLKSGGYIVINQTEALVAIDVNTGKFVGKSNRLEDTIVKTNTDAIKEIVRQIRLRDLGGIIVVDFIDMDERKNRQKVMQALEEAMRTDRAPYKILQFNDFGLVAITRKRVKQSLERTLCAPCPYCEGAGYVKSPQTIVGEILQEAHKIAAAVEGKDVMLRVGPEVAKMLKSSQNSYLQELEEILGRTVIVKSDPQLHQERFDLA